MLAQAVISVNNQERPRALTTKTALKIVFSLLLLAFVLHSTGLEKTFAKLSTANLWYVPVGVVIYLGSQWISAYRWQFLASPLGFKLSLREFYDYYLIGMYFNLFLPGAIGGDVGRMIYLAKSCGRRKREALLTLIAERGVGLVALLFLTTMFCLTPAAAPVPQLLRMAMIAMSVVGVLGFIALRISPVDAWVEKFPKLELLTQARLYWQDIPLLFKSVSLSLLVHGCMITIHLMIANALGIELPVMYLGLVYGIVALVSVAPIAFNGIGVREGAYQILLSRAGVAPETALAFALYWFLISTLTSLVGGLVLVKGHYKTPDPEEMVDEV